MEGGQPWAHGNHAIGTGARGGPLLMPGFVSPLISFTQFRDSCVALLQALQMELDDLPFSTEGINVSVDDLRIASDDELVMKSLEDKEGLQLQGKHGSEKSVVSEGENCIPVHAEASLFGGREPSSNESAVSVHNRNRGFSCQASKQEKNLSTEDDENLGLDELLENRQNLERLKGNAGFVEVSGRTEDTDLESVSDDTCQDILMGVPSDHCNETDSGQPAAVTLDNECGEQKAQNDAETVEEAKSKRRKKVSESHKKKKRGKPFDRDLRAAQLEMNGCSNTEEHLENLKREREAAKLNAPLLSLRTKNENEGSAASMSQIRNLSALTFLTSTLKADKLTSEGIKSVPENEVVICIEFYHPIKKHQKIQEFLVLGSQPLTSLRDKLYCLTDVLMKKAHTCSPSGYFLIEDTFYNDMRDEKAIDYSIPIMNWLRQQDEAMERWKAVGGTEFRTKAEVGLSNSASARGKLPSFKVADMASTLFMDLQCRIGVQYLYCHQGDCKHVLVMRDIRLVHKDDVQNMLNYPLLRFQTRLRHRKCTICDIYKATKVTYADKMAPASPCFFCENCYYLLHYSKEGVLLYSDFKVYDYYHE